MSAAQIVPPLLGLAGLAMVAQALWPSEVKRAERTRRQKLREQAAARIETAVQAQLIAHRLPDTPGNRARMLQELGRGRL